MNPHSWRASFTRRSFLPEYASLPDNAVDLVRTRAEELVLHAARCIRHLHGERWHTLCYYPELHIVPGACSACDMIMHLDRFVEMHIHANISGVVIDFLHEPDHTDQLNVAVQLYAWSIFHHGKHGHLLRQPEEIRSFADYRMGDLFGESFAHKPMRDEGDEETPHPNETSEEELKHLVQIFSDTYAEQVKRFDAWQASHAGFSVAAFPAE